VIGTASFLRGATASSHVVVLCEGNSYRLAANLLAREFEPPGPLRSLLQRCTLVLAVQTGQVAKVRGVRRESVSGVAAKLQAAGLIRCRRGRIAVLDRPGLEARTCECRAVIRQEYDRLLRTEDAARDAGARSMQARQGTVREEPACAELS
jgi:hypothetical protein